MSSSSSSSSSAYAASQPGNPNPAAMVDVDLRAASAAAFDLTTPAVPLNLGKMSPPPLTERPSQLRVKRRAVGDAKNPVKDEPKEENEEGFKKLAQIVADAQKSAKPIMSPASATAPAVAVSVDTKGFEFNFKGGFGVDSSTPVAVTPIIASPTSPVWSGMDTIPMPSLESPIKSESAFNMSAMAKELTETALNDAKENGRKISKAISSKAALKTHSMVASVSNGGAKLIPVIETQNVMLAEDPSFCNDIPNYGRIVESYFQQNPTDGMIEYAKSKMGYTSPKYIPPSDETSGADLKDASILTKKELIGHAYLDVYYPPLGIYMFTHKKMSSVSFVAMRRSSFELYAARRKGVTLESTMIDPSTASYFFTARIHGRPQEGPVEFVLISEMATGESIAYDRSPFAGSLGKNDGISRNEVKRKKWVQLSQRIANYLKKCNDDITQKCMAYAEEHAKNAQPQPQTELQTENAKYRAFHSEYASLINKLRGWAFNMQSSSPAMAACLKQVMTQSCPLANANFHDLTIVKK